MLKLMIRMLLRSVTFGISCFCFLPTYMPLVFLFRFVHVLNINKYFCTKVPYDTKKYSLKYISVAFQNLNFANTAADRKSSKKYFFSFFVLFEMSDLRSGPLARFSWTKLLDYGDQCQFSCILSISWKKGLISVVVVVSVGFLGTYHAISTKIKKKNYLKQISHYS